MDLNPFIPRPRPTIDGLVRHEYRKTLQPGEAEHLEILGRAFQPGAEVRLSDDRTGDWTAQPRDVTVVSPSRIVVERALHGDVPDGKAEGQGGTVPATLRVTVTCPNLAPVTNSFAIEYIDK